jgi:hypothetical protein
MSSGRARRGARGRDGEMSTHQPKGDDGAEPRLVAALAVSMLLAATAAVAPASAGTAPRRARLLGARSSVDAGVGEDELVVAGQPEGAAGRRCAPLQRRARRAGRQHPSHGHQRHPRRFRRGAAAVRLPAESDWQAEQGGDWDDKPGEHCSPGSAAEGETRRGRERVRLRRQPFIQNGEIDVMITPGVRGAVPSPLLLQALNDSWSSRSAPALPGPARRPSDGATARTSG